MVTHERVAERIAELSPEDLDALMEYLDRLRDAGDDPIRRAFVRALLRPPEKVSSSDRAAIDAALADGVYYSREELEPILADGMRSARSKSE